jgi:hypothetical protein
MPTLVVLFMLKLLVVKQIQTNVDTLIQFETGAVVHLPSTEKNYVYYSELAQKSLNRKQPVGVAFNNSGAISEMARADNDVTKSLLSKDKETMAVWFQGHNGTFYLRLDHPEFNRISSALQHSMQSKSHVWFVVRKPGLFIEDVLPE